MKTKIKNDIIVDENLEIVPIAIQEPVYKKLKIQITDIPNGAVSHSSYLEYLNLCYNHHYGMVISPENLWYVILCEISSHVKKNADHYREKFTYEKEGKKEISIQTGDAVVMPLEDLLYDVLFYVPTNVTSFLPKFSTMNEKAHLAHAAAFLDTVSPYYEYSMYLCGTSKVRVLGTLEDWKLMENSLTELKTIIDKMGDYFACCLEGVKGIIDNLVINPEFWGKMFYLERCGSGSQTEVQGWIRKFFQKDKHDTHFLDNFNTCISVVDYKNLSTGKKYKMRYGLFSSIIKNDFLIPEYNYYVMEEL